MESGRYEYHQLRPELTWFGALGLGRFECHLGVLNVIIDCSGFLVPMGFIAWALVPFSRC